MKKKILILSAFVLVNAIVFTIVSPPKSIAGPPQDTYWYMTLNCPCDEEEANSGHYTCEDATCTSAGNLWPCGVGWADIECGDSFVRPDPDIE